MITSSPGLSRALHHVVDAVLCAAGDQYLVRVVSKVVFPPELVRDGLFEFRHAACRGVFRFAVTDGLDSGLLDMFRRVEIRLARAQGDNIPSRRFQFRGLCGDCKGG